jgi:hypothetical protein
MSHRPLYYRLDGHISVPCSLIEWATQGEDPRRRTADDPWRVDRTPLFDDVYVSTVFLGLDHQYGDGPPLLFETMVFGLDDEYYDRCSTWEQAEAQHTRVVADVEQAVLRQLEAKRGQA